MKRYLSIFALIVIPAVLLFVILGLADNRLKDRPVKKVVEPELPTLCRHGWQFFTTQDGTFNGAAYTLDIGHDGRPIACKEKP